MLDPLAVALIRTFEVLSDLEAYHSQPCNANGRISKRSLKRIRRLRRKLEAARAGFSRRETRQAILFVVSQIAVELTKRAIEIPTCLLSARRALLIYGTKQLHQGSQRSRRSQSARLGGFFRGLRVHDLAA